MISALQVALRICRAALVFLIVFVIYGAYAFLYNMAKGSPFIWPVILLVGVPVAPLAWIAGSTIAYGSPKAILKTFSKVLRPLQPNSN